MNRKPDPDESELLVAHSVSAIVGDEGALFIHLHNEDGSIFAAGALSTATAQLMCEQISEGLKDFLAGPLSKCEGNA